MKKIPWHSLACIALGGILGGVAVGWFGAGRSSPATISGPVKLSAASGGRAHVTVRQTPLERSVEPVASNGPSGYPLNLDNPERVRRLAERDRRLIAWFKEAYGPVYDRKFAEYGIDPVTREFLMEHIAAIYRAKIEVRKVTTQMMDAQWEYRERMQKLLGDKFDDYMKYEELWPAREEMSFIREFSAKSGLSLSEDRLPELQSLLEKNRPLTAKSAGSLGGPIGEPPAQIYGTEKVIADLEQKQAALTLQAAATIAEMKERGFAKAEIDALEKYYRVQLDAYEKALDNALPASPRKIAMLEKQLTEMRQNLTANPDEIRRTTAKLDWMRNWLRSNPNFPGL